MLATPMIHTPERCVCSRDHPLQKGSEEIFLWLIPCIHWQVLLHEKSPIAFGDSDDNCKSFRFLHSHANVFG